MEKIKHKKIKNVGILFELLSRQITSDVINNTKSAAIDILKEHFKIGTNLNKELSLYQTLFKEKYSSEAKAIQLIDEVLQRNAKINKSNLRKEKFNLIKEIKKHYNLEEFTKNRINNYPIYASIYKLFENKDSAISPSEIVTSKFALVEFITSKPTDGKTVRSQLLEEFESQTSDVRKLTYKIMVDRFNDKYQVLGDRERKLLREYINNISNSTKMKEYINLELGKLKVSLNKISKTVTDPTTKIKLHEVFNIMDGIIKKKRLDDTNLLTLLHMYKLDTELKRLK